MATPTSQANSTTAPEGPERIAAPPYISYLTFKNMIEWLEKEKIPLRFDRSFWKEKYSGTVGPLLMAGLRFLHLLEGDKPQPDLQRLVEAKGDERKAVLAEILRQAYSAVKFEELPRASPSMVTEWLRNYNLQGDTLRKAESFFINACKDANISLSNAVRKKARNKAPGVGRKKGEGRHETPPSPSKASEQSKVRSGQIGQKQYEQGNLAVVVLNSGGEVSLGLSVDLFNLSETDREFVFKLVDLVRGYPRQEKGGNKEEADKA